MHRIQPTHLGLVAGVLGRECQRLFPVGVCRGRCCSGCGGHWRRDGRVASGLGCEAGWSRSRGRGGWGLPWRGWGAQASRWSGLGVGSGVDRGLIAALWTGQAVQECLWCSDVCVFAQEARRGG